MGCTAGVLHKNYLVQGSRTALREQQCDGIPHEACIVELGADCCQFSPAASAVSQIRSKASGNISYDYLEGKSLLSGQFEAQLVCSSQTLA